MPSRNLSVAGGLAPRAGSIAHDRATSVQNRMALTENAFHSDGWRSQRTPSIVILLVGLLRARGNGEFYGRRRDV